MLYLTSEIQRQFEELVSEVDWLSNTTKDTAREKIHAMIHNIGYPDLVLDNTQLQTEIEGVRLQLSTVTQISYRLVEPVKLSLTS